MDEKQEIPKEIDDHFKLFGKEPWEIEYGDKCPICNSRFDEFGIYEDAILLEESIINHSVLSPLINLI